jgi:hypothetical protein
MRGAIHHAVKGARLLLLAVALLLCAVPTAQAIRCPTPSLAFDSLLPQLTDEAVWLLSPHGRIGLFVGNNPISQIDPLGLTWYVHPPATDGTYGPPNADFVDDGHDSVVQIPVQTDGGITDLSGDYIMVALPGSVAKTLVSQGMRTCPPKSPPGSYRPQTTLPRGPDGEMLPSSPYAHTQLGTEVGRKAGPYTTAREFGENGEWIRDIHFTDHGRPNILGHVNPHQHPAVPNPTGGTPGYGPAEPFIP